ncbi:zinc carboxypeptidase [Mumia flava]|uniref:Zinc carboxypeptidase n=1 Tax=Mumia flava TaxID=1348852 RepID=A0A2M9BFI6_9ACTN|nr:M14 family zinc carboxypeptidase [Mumia flava]PJJ56715.1 zinc carboxypeptidase [Mumia flava]
MSVSRWASRLLVMVAAPALLVPVEAAPAVPAEGPALSLGTTGARSVVPAAARTAGAARRPAVLERRVIGRTRRDRPIVAYRVGDPGARRTAVVMAAMHGDERKTRVIVKALRDGRPIDGVDLWLIPTANPDGVRARTRGNARGVDLNRNFPYAWVRTPRGTSTWSGPRPKSEPETRALIRFLRRTDPDQVVSFHQPLYGIDTSGTGNRKLARRLARFLKLPRKEFSCGSGCHGTMSQWFNHRIDGALVTVELGRHPSKRYLRTTGPRGVLRALRATR